MCRAGHGLEVLSEQQLVDCDTDQNQVGRYRVDM